MISETEIKALISLIDDPDEKIFSQVKDKLLSYGNEVIPVLESEWESNNYGMVFQTRIENLIHEIQFTSVKHNLELWVEGGAKNLLDACLIINRYQYPDLDEARIRKRINQMKQDVWLELNDNLTAFEQVRIINHILFDIYGLTGNKKNYHAPQNSYISQVIETGKGNPLSLCIIYILICEQLDIPVYGVNLPNHFVLAYMDRNHIMKAVDPEHSNEEVLFYINPFSKGSIFNRKEIEQFLKQLNVESHHSFFYPCSNLSIIRRLISNLVNSFEKLGQNDRAQEVSKLLLVLPVE